MQKNYPNPVDVITYEDDLKAFSKKKTLINNPDEYINLGSLLFKHVENQSKSKGVLDLDKSVVSEEDSDDCDGQSPFKRSLIKDDNAGNI